MKEVILASPRGFCAGVVRAIDIVEICLERFGPPVYCKHQVVHNEHVCRRLEEKGVVFIESVEEAPEGSLVVFSAHGSPPDDYRTARARKLKVIDATCPLVTKVHAEAQKYGKEGRAIFVVGHDDHVEVRGTLGKAKESQPTHVYTVNPDRISTEGLPSLPSDVTKGVVLTQTTLSQEDVKPAVDYLRKFIPDVVVRDDICYATQNRQAAIRALAELVQVILVIGSKASSNSNRLKEVAQDLGCPAYLVSELSEVPWTSVTKAETIGVTSGASTPEELVETVVRRLQDIGYHRRELEVIPEKVEFKLPRELR